MTGLFKIVTDKVEAEIAKRMRAGARSAALLLAATILLVAGFIVLMYAAYLLLLMYMPAQYAALIIAGAFLLVGLILLAAISRPPSEAKSEKAAPKLPPKADPSADDLEAALKDYVRANSKQATLIALIAGAIVGYSPEIRRGLIQVLERRADRRAGKDTS